MRPTTMSLQGRVSALALTLALTALPSWASTVQITSNDESVSITGELVDFTGDDYVIQTAFGRLIISVNEARCEGEACPEIDRSSIFAFSGSRALADTLIPELISGYASYVGSNMDSRFVSEDLRDFTIGSDSDPVAQVSVAAANTRDGLAALLDGDATFALATRRPSSREVRRAEEVGIGNLRNPQQEHIVAVDGLILVTHPNNPVRAIREVNAALAFSGRIDNWSQLGGSDAPINLYIREPDSGTREAFEGLLMRPNGVQIAPTVTVLPSDQAIADAVARDVNGLGFTSFAKTGEAKALDIEGVCGLRTPATAFTIKTEEYPLTRLMYMYQAANADIDFHAQGFLDFMESDRANEVIAAAGFVDQSVSSATINSQGIRVASAILNSENMAQTRATQQMLQLFLGSDRLSTTFRFETGSSRPDARAEADIVRLAELLEGDQFRNKEVFFVGFTDSVGDADLNLILSLQRADQIRSRVLEVNPDLSNRMRIRAGGFGEASPLGCNETDVGRRTNRRVEIWVRDIAAGDQT